ncbi:MAG: thrombospondin type 3 repeat-containing protein [Myxococcota bacterium]
MSRSSRRFLIATGLLLALPSATRATVPDDLCTGDPCAITGSHTIDPVLPLALLDFGARHVILKSGATVDVGAGNSMRLTAGKLTIDPGGQFKAVGDLVTSGGSIEILCDGDITIGTRTGTASFNLDGASGGNLSLTSTNGNIVGTIVNTSNRHIRVRNTALAGDGGEVDLTASAGDIDLPGVILASGGLDGAGGLLSLDAINVTLGTVDLTGGNSGGGFLDGFFITGNFELLGNLSVKSIGTDGDGGEICITTDGAILFPAPGTIDLTGSSGTTAGTAGLLELSAENDIRIEKAINLFAFGSAGAGELALIARNITIQDPIDPTQTIIDARGAVPLGDGPGISLDATGNVSLGGIRASSGNGLGTLDILAEGSVALLGPIDFSASGDGGGGGDLAIAAEGPLNIAAGVSLKANGSTVGGFGGSIELEGCSVNVGPGVLIQALEFSGGIEIADGAPMDLSGATLEVDPNSGLITLAYREPPAPDPDLMPGLTLIGPSTTVQRMFITNCDVDSDGVLNFSDNCRFAANPGQQDNGGIGAGSTPDGIGDVCQCGDVDGDGVLTPVDVMDARMGLADPSHLVVAPEKCNVIGPIDVTLNPTLPITLDCVMNDVAVMERALLDPNAPPGVSQVCKPAQPGP